METEPFKDTFGPKAQRKRPRLDVGDFEELSRVGATSQEVEGETSTLGEYITQIGVIDPTLRLSKTSPPLKSKLTPTTSSRFTRKEHHGASMASFTKSSTLRTLSSTYSMLEIQSERCANLCWSTSRRRKLISRSSWSLTSVTSFRTGSP